MKDGERKSKGFGFIGFELPEKAKKALEAMNSTQPDSVTSMLSPKSEQEKVGLDCPPRGLEPIKEVPMSDFSSCLDSPTLWDSPRSPTLWDSPPFPRKFEPVEFVLKPGIDD